MNKASFLVWKYRFYPDRVDIVRNFFFEKCTSVSTLNVECAAITSNILLMPFKRCNLTIITPSNNYTLLGIPTDYARSLCERFTDSGNEEKRFQITTRDLLKKSVLQSRMKWYFLILAALWATVLIFGGKYISAETANALSHLAFRRSVLFGTFVMSLALPQVIIWIWALTGGVLYEFIRYYRYTATRTRDVICFEYGIITYRKVYIPVKRIAVCEYIQSPLMQICRCGRVSIFAVGYNSYFMKSDTILPFVTTSRASVITRELLPEFEVKYEKESKAPFRFFLIYWTSLIPIIFLILSFFYGYGWAILALITSVILLADYSVHRSNSRLICQNGITYASRGGFFHKVTLIRNERLESCSSYGSVMKKRKGYVNFSFRVFGRRHKAIRVRNIPADTASHYSIPER